MENLHNLSGLISVVTGANSGIGKATTKLLAKLNAKVVMVVRNYDKGVQALEELKEEISIKNIDIMICDFSSQKSIRDFVKKFKSRYKELNILINNHGAINQKKSLIDDNIETTFAVNHLGYFLLTNLLLDMFKDNSFSRIINTASGAYAATRKLTLNDYNFEKRRYRGFKAYSESKLYNIMFTYYLAKKLKKRDIAVNTLTPGFVRTNFGRNNVGMGFMVKLMAPLAISPKKAAERILYLAASKEVDGITGKYFSNNKIVKTSSLTQNEDAQKQLWDLSLKLVNL